MMHNNRHASVIGRLGAPTNLRAGGIMRSSRKKKDAHLQRRRTKAALRRGDFEHGA